MLIFNVSGLCPIKPDCAYIYMCIYINICISTTCLVQYDRAYAGNWTWVQTPFGPIKDIYIVWVRMVTCMLTLFKIYRSYICALLVT